MNLTATVEALNLTQLAGALTSVDASLPAMLGNTSDVTIFAPINSAFAAIANVVRDFITVRRIIWLNVLSFYHRSPLSTPRPSPMFSSTTSSTDPSSTALSCSLETLPSSRPPARCLCRHFFLAIAEKAV